MADLSLDFQFTSSINTVWNALYRFGYACKMDVEK